VREAVAAGVSHIDTAHAYTGGESEEMIGAALVSRRKHHAPTITYINRRLGEGKSVRDAIRCLKRYLARHLFRVLEAMPQAA
jgi:aryl-alcohol dehydrogenase-like predicted oxidoreductase